MGDTTMCQGCGRMAVKGLNAYLLKGRAGYWCTKCVPRQNKTAPKR